VGHTIGYPTANVPYQGEKLDFGVYLAGVALADGSRYYGLAVFGVIPISEEGGQIIEVHLLDFTGDLYGQQLQIELGEKLRDLVPYTTDDNLILQIERDVVEARRVFSSGIV
jgi:riboflavin kinase/FMN adenylyltransferase